MIHFFYLIEADKMPAFMNIFSISVLIFTSVKNENMKTYTIFLTLVFLLFSCSSFEDKAKKAIKDNLKLTLDDYKSYEPVQFGKLEYAMSIWADAPEVTNLLKKETYYIAKCQEYKEKYTLYEFDVLGKDFTMYFDLSGIYLDSAEFIDEKIKTFEANFVPERIGWQMNHSFRAKTSSGNLRINKYLFIFDNNITRVTKAVDLSEE